MTNMNVIRRLLIAAAVVAGIQGGIYVLHVYGMPREVTLPNRHIRNFPLSFGPWQGEDRELSRREEIVISPTWVVNRTYRDDQGREVSFHNVVSSKNYQRMPHDPKRCYRETGWKITSEKDVSIEVPGGSPTTVRVIEYEQQAQRVLIMYWYALGDHIVLDRFQLRQAAGNFWGKKTWPAVVKVLLQTSLNDGPDKAEARLRSIAAEWLAWMNKVSSQPIADGPTE